jgi:hypothetical protein
MKNTHLFMLAGLLSIAFAGMMHLRAQRTCVPSGERPASANVQIQIAKQAAKELQETASQQYMKDNMTPLDRVLVAEHLQTMDASITRAQSIVDRGLTETSGVWARSPWRKAGRMLSAAQRKLAVLRTAESTVTENPPATGEDALATYSFNLEAYARDAADAWEFLNRAESYLGGKGGYGGTGGPGQS